VVPTARTTPQRSEEIAAFVRRLYRAIVVGDVEAIDGAFSWDPSVLAIGTDAAEWWSGWSVVTGMFRRQIEEADGDSFAVDMRPGLLACFEEGSVGWSQDNPVVVMPDGSEFDSRLTLVLHVEGVSWKIIQLHFSFGIANEAMFGKTYTTNLDAMADSVSEERPDLSSVAAPDGTVTIVFTDVEASTEINERLGDRRWLDLLRWHDGVVRGVAGELGGSVVKSQGDGYMLAFGSASHALDFCLEIQEATRAGFEGEAVRVRIGVNTGDAIRDGDDFFGHAVTVAARVASQAHGEETLVTDLVAGLVAGARRFAFGPSLHVELKGLSGDFGLRALARAW
jgi:class 3 adenylate cyclase